MSLITFYQSDNDSRLITKVLSGGVDIECNIRTDIDIYNPVLLLQGFNPVWNYFKWDNRYYFIRDYEYSAKGIYRIESHIDVLMTFKDYILQVDVNLSHTDKLTPYYDNNFEYLSTSTIKKYPTNVTFSEIQTVIMSAMGAL